MDTITAIRAATVVVALAILATGVQIMATQKPEPGATGAEQAPDAPSANSEWRTLTPQEERVIVHKGTERAFTGKYTDHTEQGVYTCRRCGAPLYESSAKFKSGCGWPSFDQEIEGNVKQTPDADGRRTEITCARCGGHLGHVFLGEGFTERNTRHCVNSISMDFVPASERDRVLGRQASSPTETAIFAAGCFWGVEYFLQEAEGVVETTVGYIGGTTKNPTYREVCSRTTGHAEAVKVEFDPARTSFEKLARLFFEIHDPTQVNRQGPDIGDQYRSEIFFTGPRQQRVAKKLVAELEDTGLEVATRITEAPRFWPAEEYHQDYCRKNRRPPHCHRRVERF